jgi:hypothetical protein
MGLIPYHDMLHEEFMESAKRRNEIAAAHMASWSDSSEDYVFTSPRAIALHAITEVLGHMPLIECYLNTSLHVTLTVCM